MASERKKVEVYSAEALADLVDGTQHHSEVLDSEGWILPEVKGKFFTLVWWENCVTCHSASDATLYGPFDTVEEAKEA